MPLGADRYASRGDTAVFIVCLALSLVSMSLPEPTREGIAGALRDTVLLPLLELQDQSEQLRTSRARFTAVMAERDSAALAAAFLPELRAENDRLRALLGLGQRLGGGFIPAEVLHQSSPADPLTLVVSAGRKAGVMPLSAVVAPAGLVGIVQVANNRTSEVVTWAHPEFRASAMAADGSVFGIVAPYSTEGPEIWLLELRGVPYRQIIPTGTVIVTSGLGGVLPRGIPIGTILGVARETEWERVYLVLPAVHPASASHVLILRTGNGAGTGGGRTALDDMRGAFGVGVQSVAPTGAGAAVP